MKPLFQKALWVVIYLFAIIILPYGCKEQADKFKEPFLSKEDRLINGRWAINSIMKNGADISIDSCNLTTSNYKGEDVYFEEHGEVVISCKYLNQNKGSYGTWELTDHKKDINVILTDSIDHSQFNLPLAPITPPLIIKWEILSLKRNNFKIKEIRGNDIYEFEFNNMNQ